MEPDDDSLIERDGRLVIPASGATIDDEVVQSLRDADQSRNADAPGNRTSPRSLSSWRLSHVADGFRVGAGMPVMYVRRQFGGVRHARAVLAVTVVFSFVGTTLAAGQQAGEPVVSGDDGPALGTSPASLDFSGTAAVDRAMVERARLMAIGRSPDHKAARVRDAQAFGDESRGEALGTLRESFGDVLDSSVYAPLDGVGKILAFPSPFVAQVKQDDGKTALVQTMVPNRAMTDTGTAAPVDLSLNSGTLSYRSGASVLTSRATRCG